MKKLLLAIIIIFAITLTACSEKQAYEEIDDVWASNYEIAALQEQIDQLLLELESDNDDVETDIDDIVSSLQEFQNELNSIEYPNIPNYDEDFTELLQLMYNVENQVIRNTLYLEVISGVEYNTTEPQCSTSLFTCYNDNFYYRIVDDNNIEILIGVYGDYRIDITLQRQENNTWATTKIGYITQDSAPNYEEFYNVESVNDESYPAIIYVVEMIRDEIWLDYIGDGDTIWASIVNELVDD